MNLATRREFLQQAAAGVVTAAVSVQAAGGEKATTPFPENPAQGAHGPVQTVQGPLDASKLGFTLPHEHICASSAGFWQAWPEFFGGREDFIAKAVGKLKTAREEGVKTIIDVTTIDTGRDIRLIEEVARKSGMQVIACTGHWLDPSRSMSARTVEELTDFFVKEIELGIEGTSIKAGVIKVATDRKGVTPFLDRALRAAARASKATGIPVTTHSYSPDRVGEKQADIFEAEGLSPVRVCIGHSDDTADMDYLIGLAKRGYTIGMDHMFHGIQGPLPWQKRAECVKNLVDAGFVDRIFLSNDWFFDISLGDTATQEAMDRMNPDGILFVTRKTIPYLKQIGVSDHTINTITVKNPMRFFSGAHDQNG
jgi:phosphotriesterase-related protein